MTKALRTSPRFKGDTKPKAAPPSKLAKIPVPPQYRRSKTPVSSKVPASSAKSPASDKPAKSASPVKPASPTKAPIPAKPSTRVKPRGSPKKK